jgi:hypothetical protein
MPSHFFLLTFKNIYRWRVKSAWEELNRARIATVD